MLDQELFDRIVKAWSVFETPSVRDVHGDPPYDYMAKGMIREIDGRPFDNLDCTKLESIRPPLEDIDSFQYQWYYFGGLMLCYLSKWYATNSLCTDDVVGRLAVYSRLLERDGELRKHVTVAQLEVSADVLESIYVHREICQPDDIGKVIETKERLIKLVGEGESSSFFGSK